MIHNVSTCLYYQSWKSEYMSMLLWPHAAGPESKDANTWNAYSIMFVWKWMDSLGVQKILNKSTSTHVINKYSILWVMQTSRQALLFGQNSSDFCIWLLETVTITMSMDETTGWCNARMHDDMIKTFWHQIKRNWTSIDKIKTNQWDLMCPDCWSNGICPAPKAKVA